MDMADAKAESLFARALELPPGRPREQWIAAECGEDGALRREVETLLRAHDTAGTFLDTPIGISTRGAPAAAAGHGTASLSAATYAEAFLRSAAGSSAPSLEVYLASLPTAVQREARDRIEAGFHVRRLIDQMDGAAQLQGEDWEEEPPRLSGYRIERKLGEGSLGIVYAARDEKLDRAVAIKVLRRPADAAVRHRILGEARKAAALADPAVVTVYSVLDETDPPALVMELVEGFALDRFTEHLQFEQKAQVLRDVVRALTVAHARGLVHRDLKPDNILVGPDMRPRILDFGLALSLEEARRLGGGFEGTPLYASPEQALGKPLTPASDIFSFGSLMFKVLTGRAPFGGDNMGAVLEAIATTAPPFLREVAVGVPEDLQAVCLACLSWDPADRPTAADVALELGRFLVGEPVRLKPKLYDDLLRRSISEYSSQAQSWASQSIISPEDRDALEVVHRRLLADEDHWIIDAQRVTLLQTVLLVGTWLSVVAAALIVWLLRDELGAPWRWLLPSGIAVVLLAAGRAARRASETLAAATFLAGAALTVAPATLSLLAEGGVLTAAAPGVTQLFASTFTNQQLLAASLTALAVSVFGLVRLQMTGFAWTTATMATLSYLALLLQFNWLELDVEIQALTCLPLVGMEAVGLALERRGRVRWTRPFHLVALAALVASLDVMALQGSTLEMIGFEAGRWSYLDETRLWALSLTLNGMLFLGLMLLTERSHSLDLRRSSRWFEILAIIHILTALFINALEHRGEPFIHVDVWLHLAFATLFAVLAPFRSRWRLLVGGLGGLGMGSYLLVELGLVARIPFVVGLGLAGLTASLSTFAYVRRRQNAPRNVGPASVSAPERHSSPSPPVDRT
jgi:serine/threonine protein kinase